MAFFLIADSVFLTLLMGLVILFAFYVYNLQTNNLIRKIGLPGPAPIPFLGEFFHVIRKGIHENDTSLVRKYGKIFGIYEGATPVVMISDPDLLKKVLIKDAHVFVNRRVVRGVSSLFESGLTGLVDDQWKNARAIVSPTFSTAKLKGMMALMNDIGEEWNKRLLAYADTQEMFNIKDLASGFTLDNIASCLFGVETNSLQNENNTLVFHLKKFFEISLTSVSVLIFFISPKLAGFLGKKGYSLFPRASEYYLANMLTQILERRRSKVERRNDFIQIMVDHEEEVKKKEADKSEEKPEPAGSIRDGHWNPLKKTLTEEEILGQAVIFLVAGYETTSVLLSFFFYVMAVLPDIQEKVYAEIQQALGDDETVTQEKLISLHYLDMVINETLRMYPPVLRFDRVASTDYEIEGYTIPKGTTVGVPIYPIHHNPAVYSDPDKFIPERFSASEKAKRDPMNFLPFGDGPRNCIGMRFALLETKIAIVKALRKVEFLKCEKTAVPLQFDKLGFLVPKSGIWIRVSARSQ